MTQKRKISKKSCSCNRRQTRADRYNENLDMLVDTTLTVGALAATAYVAGGLLGGLGGFLE